MRAQRVKLAARVLPDVAAVVPMEAQSPKCPAQRRRGCRLKPNPFADDLGHTVLLREAGAQVIQNCLGGQFAVGTTADKFAVHFLRSF